VVLTTIVILATSTSRSASRSTQSKVTGEFVSPV
jgi:hypothetical protein